jgi:hypothetical protein
MDLPFAYCYLDGLYVASPDLHTHLMHLSIVFERLRDLKLVIDLEKCILLSLIIRVIGALHF